MSRKDTFVLLVIPPQAIIEFFDSYRKKYAQYTSYVIPPHITIYPPFHSNFSSESDLIGSLLKYFSDNLPFTVKLESVGYFEGKNNVAFFKPDNNSSKLLLKLLKQAVDCLGRDIKNAFSGYNFIPEKFKPHMTIVEKIPNNELPRLKKELNKEKVDKSFDVDSIYLYKQSGDSNIWKERAKIEFTL